MTSGTASRTSKYRMKKPSFLLQGPCRRKSHNGKYYPRYRGRCQRHPVSGLCEEVLPAGRHRREPGGDLNRIVWDLYICCNLQYRENHIRPIQPRSPMYVHATISLQVCEQKSLEVLGLLLVGFIFTKPYKP